MTDFDQIS